MVLFCGRCVSIASFIHFNGMEWNKNSKTILYSVQWIWNFHISFLTAAKKRFPISNNVFMKYMRDWITLAAMTTVTVAVALVVSVAVCECSYQRIGGDGANVELLYNIYIVFLFICVMVVVEFRLFHYIHLHHRVWKWIIAPNAKGWRHHHFGTMETHIAVQVYVVLFLFFPFSEFLSLIQAI